MNIALTYSPLMFTELLYSLAPLFISRSHLFSSRLNLLFLCLCVDLLREVGQRCRHSGLMIRLSHRLTLTLLFLFWIWPCGLTLHLGNRRGLILYSGWGYEGEVITIACPLWLQVPYPNLRDEILCIFPRFKHMMIRFISSRLMN